MPANSASNPRSARSLLLLAVFALTCALASPLAAQVSLATVVDLAQAIPPLFVSPKPMSKRPRPRSPRHRTPIFPTFRSVPLLVTLMASPPVSPRWEARTCSRSFLATPAPVHQGRACRSRSGQPWPQRRQEQVALDASTAYIELDTVNRELEAARQQEDLTGELIRSSNSAPRQASTPTLTCCRRA